MVERLKVASTGLTQTFRDVLYITSLDTEDEKVTYGKDQYHGSCFEIWRGF